MRSLVAIGPDELRCLDKNLGRTATVRTVTYRNEVSGYFEALVAKMTGNVRFCPVLRRERKSRKEAKSNVLNARMLRDSPKPSKTSVPEVA